MALVKELQTLCQGQEEHVKKSKEEKLTWEHEKQSLQQQLDTIQQVRSCLGCVIRSCHVAFHHMTCHIMWCHVG